MDKMTAEDITSLCIKLSAYPEYTAYRKALRAANKATPTEIPKADGLLNHAETQLKKAVESTGLPPEQAISTLSMLKSMAQNM